MRPGPSGLSRDLAVGIEEVDAVLDQYASALLDVPEPVAGRNRLGEVVTRDRAQWTEQFRCGKRPEHRVCRQVAHDVVHTKRNTCLVCPLDHAIRLSERQGKWLLAKDTLASSERSGYDGFAQMRGRGNMNDFHSGIGDEIVPICRQVDVGCDHSREHRRIEVSGGEDPNVRRLPVRLKAKSPELSSADERDASRRIEWERREWQYHAISMNDAHPL